MQCPHINVPCSTPCKYCEEKEMSEWIKTQDQMPEAGKEVVCLINGEFPRIGGYSECLEMITYRGGDRSGEVTHWLQLPPLPKT